MRICRSFSCEEGCGEWREEGKEERKEQKENMAEKSRSLAALGMTELLDRRDERGTKRGTDTEKTREKAGRSLAVPRLRDGSG
jgi:hypothetical protein